MKYYVYKESYYTHYPSSAHPLRVRWMRYCRVEDGAGDLEDSPQEHGSEIRYTEKQGPFDREESNELIKQLDIQLKADGHPTPDNVRLYRNDGSSYRDDK